MAAGLGFKTFTSGEVLTAADTNGYLMQGINVFANASARTAAITSPQEGQYSYLKDTNALEYYDGAAWVGAPVGDITGVTAGTGISGGGTSGTVTVTNSMATEIAAKGDLIVGTGAATFDNLTAGTTGQTIVADSTASTGLKYSNNAPLGGMTSLGTVALTGATTLTLSGLSNISRVTLLINGASSVNASSVITLRFNGDSTNNYGFAGNYSFGGTLANAYNQNDTSIPVGKLGNVATNVVSALVNIQGGFSDGMLQYNLGSYANGVGYESYNWTGFYNNTKITSISLISSTGNFDAGFMYVFGA